jgi:RNA polymerase sigma-70 factor (ECF subfamily)
VKGPPRKAEDPGEVETLGKLLYAASKPRIPESDWVALTRAVAGGDEMALQELYHRTHRIVFTSIMRIVHDSQTAEELTVDVFHDVWRRASAYEPADGTVIGWIMNQARSRAIDRQRFDGRKKRVEPHPATLPAESADASSAPFDRFDNTDRLHDAVARLSAEERSAIETTFFSGLTHIEAAAHLEQPLGTFKTRIRTALAKLRVVLGDDGEPA